MSHCPFVHTLVSAVASHSLNSHVNVRVQLEACKNGCRFRLKFRLSQVNQERHVNDEISSFNKYWYFRLKYETESLTLTKNVLMDCSFSYIDNFILDKI